MWTGRFVEVDQNHSSKFLRNGDRGTRSMTFYGDKRFMVDQ